MSFLRQFVRRCHQHLSSKQFISHENYETDYYSSHENHSEILNNIKLRHIQKDFEELFIENNPNNFQLLSHLIIKNISLMPNKLDPIWYETENIDYKTIEECGTKVEFDFKTQTAEALLQKLGLLYLSDKKLGNLGLVGGKRSYCVFGDLSRLEQALTRWTIKTLINDYNFTPVIVPQLLYSDIIKSCGFTPFGLRSQVYTLKGDQNICLTGTAEMPLASLNIGETFPEEDLPKKYCSLSRCYRAEAKTTKESSGLFRVHYFNKVEMFGITTDQQSSVMLEDFICIQKSLFEQLGICFKLIDMPPHELGLSAYRKFDIEAYMAGRNTWGEISSASNCTDYQSRRLNIKYRTLSLNEETNEIFSDKFVHTVNATACAVPRMLITICEQNQTSDGYIVIPQVLRPFMNGQNIIDKRQPVFHIIDDPLNGQILKL